MRAAATQRRQSAMIAAPDRSPSGNVLPIVRPAGRYARYAVASNTAVIALIHSHPYSSPLAPGSVFEPTLPREVSRG
jgi:hypothetical protein